MSTPATDFKIPENEAVKNMVIIAIRVGKRPLQGTKLLVRIAISRSLGDVIIRHPITPAALQPNPMHIVRACFPQAEHFLKGLSRLNAILGKTPESSKNVNRGKKISIGGSITDITQPETLTIPKITGAYKTFGMLRYNADFKRNPSSFEKR